MVSFLSNRISIFSVANNSSRNGKQSSLVEKMRGGNIVRAIKEERGGRPEAYIFEEGDKDAGIKTFWDALGGVPKKIKSAKEGGDDNDAAREAAQAVKLFRLSDKGGTLNFTLEKTGDVKKTDLDSNDAFILDNGAEVFVWIGKRASRDEKKFVRLIPPIVPHDFVLILFFLRVCNTLKDT